MAFFRKLLEPRIWERIFRERLSEPLHLNLLSLLAAGSGFETKVYFDLVIRQHNAFCLLQAAKFAQDAGYESFRAVEFGVANGAGLLNMVEIAARVAKSTGIKIELTGFDSGSGMPPPLDYRDHPDLYGSGDFPMQDYQGLRARLPANAQLVIGNLSDTIGPFLSSLRPECPVGYAVIDVDYYSSTVDCMKMFTGAPNLYLPEVLLYCDDINYPQHNPWQGEYLALNEFNSQNEMRKVHPFNMLRERRLFKNAIWIDQIYVMHILDHAHKGMPRGGARVVQGNPYLGIATRG